MLWTAAEAAGATGGHATGDWVASGVSIDSRSLAPGDLFVALADRRDGHLFVADALARGAAAAMVTHRPDGVAEDAPLLVVPDVQAALEALGRAGRARSRARVVAVTGSVGKTSTKEMLRVALASAGSVHAAVRSFNNHWGVPLTLARCPPQADFAVVEIGMNRPGEIAPLAAQARPDVAVITTIAEAHIEAFEDGLAGIAREKAAIFSGLVPAGVAIYPADLPTSPVLAAAARAAGAVARPFGEGAPAHLAALSADAEGTRFSAVSGSQAVDVALAVPGAHFARNALAALLAAEALGVAPAQAARGLADWVPPEGRGQRREVALSGGSFTLIDDAYNANPASMAAALATLALGSPGPGGRRIAILGDMRELGAAGPALHAGLADAAAGAAECVHAVGPLARHLWGALPPARRGLWKPDAQAMALAASGLAGPGDLVLVKASLGTGLGAVISALTSGTAPPGEAG